MFNKTRLVCLIDSLVGFLIMNGYGSLDLSFYKDYLIPPANTNPVHIQDVDPDVIRRGQRLVIIKEKDSVPMQTNNNV